jgi:phosphoribosylformylglycinamidine cyclo-ligase
MVDQNKGLSYSDAGVDIDAGNELITRIKPSLKKTIRPGAISSIGGFGGLFDLKAAGFKDPILVAATDGVGTKLKIAIETKQLSTIGIDLVAMCVNDLICQGAEPLFFLDYFATGNLILEDAEIIIEGIATGCKEAGCALIGGETAEMPGMYQGEDFDLAGFSVGAVERGHELPKTTKVGDIIIGLNSDGIHSNGYSLVRKIVEKSGLKLTDTAPFEDLALGKALLRPTKLYVNQCLQIMDIKGIRAFAHITGGGLTENVIRTLTKGQGVEINLSNWELPPMFKWLSVTGGVDKFEMLKTFNCGIGMAVICSRAARDNLFSLLEKLGEKPVIIGHVTDRSEVEYSGNFI